MSRITVTKPIDPAALKAALGVDVLTSGGDDPDAATFDVIADVDEATLQAAVDGYSPPADPAEEFRKALEAATTVAALRDALLGKAGPGAEPRRPTGA